MGLFTKKTTEASFSCGVLDTFPLKDSDDLVIVGTVKGTVTAGCDVMVFDPGNDHGTAFRTTVKALEIKKKSVSEATDCFAALRVSEGSKTALRPGSVICTENIPAKTIRAAYVNALGDLYIARNHEITDAELMKMTLSDCAEVWRLFTWYHAKDSEEQKKQSSEVFRKIAEALRMKLLNAKEICCFYSTKTGQPFLHAQIIDQKDGTYRVTPPSIRLVTKAYEAEFREMYPDPAMELKTITAGEDGKGIRNFFYEAFHLNGACGASVLTVSPILDASVLSPKPDYTGVPAVQIPVTNPALVRWILLMGQTDPNDEKNRIPYNLYNRFMSRELLKAKLIVPIKTDGETPQPDENGKAVLPEGMKMRFPVMTGKNGGKAIQMYTDWKRLRSRFGEGWNALIQPVSGMIEQFDVLINVTDHPAEGICITKENYQSMMESERRIS